ncbi:IPT/TIG domain-containing protein [Polaribacter sp.]|uniref:IPT/TIG domain-containing protein n=1 Tax=Polaribacter sp. TaxID=1920175 RepID=UPI0035C7C125
MKITVDGSGFVSSTSVSFATIVATVITVSSFVVLFKSSTATGGLLFTVNVAGGVDGVSQL